MLVNELSSRLGLEGVRSKLVHEKWTGPWKVKDIMSEGSINSAVVEMNRRSKQQHHASVADMKPFHARSLHLRHSIENEFAIPAWDADLGLARNPEDVAPL